VEETFEMLSLSKAAAKSTGDIGGGPRQAQIIKAVSKPKP
jgi:hypothetical protein